MSETEAVICLTYKNMQAATTAGLQFRQLTHMHTIMSDELLVHKCGYGVRVGMNEWMNGWIARLFHNSKLHDIGYQILCTK
jgi:hypothetical protein